MAADVGPAVKLPKGKSLASQEATLTSSINSSKMSREEPRQCLLDFVEWWCHKLISGKTVEDLAAAECELIKAVANLGVDPSELSFGRLYNRCELAALSLDVAFVGHKHNQPHDQTQFGITLWEHWAAIREELILTKSRILRRDANVDIALKSLQERQAKAVDTPDIAMERSPLFNQRYQEVIRLLQVQVSLTLFHSQLTDLVAANSSSDNNTNINNKRLVRDAIEQYEHSITKLFTPSTATATSIEDDKSTASSVSVTQLPPELAGFLLKDLYQTSAAKSGSSSPSSNASSTSENPSSALAQRLLSHVDSILQGTGTYSHSTCQQKVRKLLQDWHQTLLETPTLVKLGYGGTGDSAPSAKQAIAEEDAMLRRFSETGTGGWDPFTMPDPLLFDYDNLTDLEDDVKDQLQRLPAFVPCPWPQPTDQDNDQEDRSYQYTEEDKRLLQEHKTKRRNKPVDLIHLKNSYTLYSDTEEDPLHASVPTTRKRDLTQYQPSGFTLPDRRHKRPRTTHTSKSKTTKQVPISTLPRIRVSQTELQAIREGVRKFGKGRWTIVQKHAGGLLDKLSPQNIKIAYYQLKRRGKMGDV